MGNKPGNHYLAFNEIIDEVSIRNKDKVIHKELKETKFDDVILSIIAPESTQLRDSIELNSQKLVDHTEYEVTQFAEPCQIDQLLRVSFWDELNTAHAEGRALSERKVFQGVCSYTYWVRVRDELQWKMAYVLCPIMAYSKANKLGLHLGQKAMIEILNASPYVSDGKGGKKLDTKVAQLQLQAFNAVQDRVHGKAVQRIQSHNTNENSVPKKESIEELQKEIELLEGKKKDIPIIVDVNEQ